MWWNREYKLHQVNRNSNSLKQHPKQEDLDVTRDYVDDSLNFKVQPPIVVIDDGQDLIELTNTTKPQKTSYWRNLINNSSNFIKDVSSNTGKYIMQKIQSSFSSEQEGAFKKLQTKMQQSAKDVVNYSLSQLKGISKQAKEAAIGARNSYMVKQIASVSQSQKDAQILTRLEQKYNPSKVYELQKIVQPPKRSHSYYFDAQKELQPTKIERITAIVSDTSAKIGKYVKEEYKQSNQRKLEFEKAQESGFARRLKQTLNMNRQYQQNQLKSFINAVHINHKPNTKDFRLIPLPLGDNSDSLIDIQRSYNQLIAFMDKKHVINPRYKKQIFKIGQPLGDLDPPQLEDTEQVNQNADIPLQKLSQPVNKVAAEHQWIQRPRIAEQILQKSVIYDIYQIGNQILTINLKSQGKYCIGLTIHKPNKYHYYTKNFVQLDLFYLNRLPLYFERLKSQKQGRVLFQNNTVMMQKDIYNSVLYYSLRHVVWGPGPSPYPTRNGFNLRQNQMQVLINVIRDEDYPKK